MKITISSTKAARNLGDCLSRIRHTGDSYVLTKGRRAVAELIPIADESAVTLGELINELKRVEADAGFADDLSRVNKADTLMENPWD